jgi:Flp pilus assembly protein TadD
VAEQLDRSERHRWLRALLAGESRPRAASVAGLVGPGSFWPALWELTRGDDWRQLREVRREIDPRTEPVLTVLLLAQAYAAVGDAAGAEQVLCEAATARPDQVKLLAALGMLLEFQGPSRRGNAIEYYRAARARRPRLGIALSEALVRDGRPGEAEGVLRDLLRLKRETPVVYNDLGLCLDAQKKYKAAETAYRNAIDLAPDYAAPHCNLGMCLADQERYEEAERACRQAIDRWPDRADAHYNLGCVLAKRKNQAAAGEAFRKAIGLRPDWAEPYYNLGNALAAQGESGAAEAAYRQAIAFRPNFALAHNNLGMVLSQQRKPGAEAAFRKAIDLRPDLAEAYNNLGMVLGRRREYGEAEAAFRKAIDLRPGFALAHFNLADILTQQARFGEALAFGKKGDDLLPARDPLREEARPLLQQCQRFMTLDARLPAVLRGAEKPGNAAEQIEFAQLCVLKKLYAAAAHLYGDALTAEPKLANDVRGAARYNAACAAALAGCARGWDTHTLDDKERARWRRQAREWLRQDLAWWGKALDNGNAQAKAEVRTRMPYWQTDSDLAGLREPGALKAMSPDERNDCLALWQQVAALLGRVQTTK